MTRLVALLLSLFLGVSATYAEVLPLGSIMPTPAMLEDTPLYESSDTVAVCMWGSEMRLVKFRNFMYPEKRGIPARPAMTFVYKTIPGGKAGLFAVVFWGVAPQTLDSVLAVDRDGDGKVDERLTATGEDLTLAIFGSCKRLPDGAIHVRRLLH